MATVSSTEVFVTGVGVVSCLGGTAGEFWAGLDAGASRPVPVPGLSDRVPDALAYRAPDGPSGDAGDPGDPRGRATGFALRAAREAVADAGLSPEHTADMAVVIGTAGGDGGVREGGCPPAGTGGRRSLWRRRSAGRSAPSAPTSASATPARPAVTRCPSPWT